MKNQMKSCVVLAALVLSGCSCSEDIGIGKPQCKDRLLDRSLGAFSGADRLTCDVGSQLTHENGQWLCRCPKEVPQQVSDCIAAHDALYESFKRINNELQTCTAALDKHRALAVVCTEAANRLEQADRAKGDTK